MTRWVQTIFLIVTFLIGNVLPTSARAEDPSTAAALKAAEILELHCADVAGGKATESAQALSVVSPVLAEVSAAHDETGTPFLLYWRGRLNLCLDREDRAKEDLTTFIKAAADEAAYGTQVREARALLNRLARAERGGLKIHTPGLAVAGGAMFGAGVVFSGLSAWQWQIASSKHAEFMAGERLWSETQSINEEGEAAQDRAHALLGVGISTGIGGIVTFVLSMVPPPKLAGRLHSAPIVHVATLPEGGMAFGLEGRW
jgi:hypothetical protein